MSQSKSDKCPCKVKNDVDEPISRRDFLGLSALWACVITGALTLIGLLKFPKPALLPDVSNIFKIGKLEDIPIGTERIFKDKKVLIKRDDEGIVAISLICTHLGCIVTKEDKGFSCPCHGSKFNEIGDIISGPAPKGLNWLEISQVPGGKLAVNAGKHVRAGTKFKVS